MKTAAIYCRFSSDLQNPRSIEDQERLCREIAERNGLHVVEVCTDAAISGTKMDRPGLNRLMAGVEARRFGFIIVEAQDRLTRHEGDYHTIRDKLKFHGVKLMTQSGIASDLEGSITAIMSSHYIANLIEKSKRGMAGVISRGKHAGGRAYGYRPVPGSAGDLQIVDDEAAIVREVFEAYASGQTPRAIAHELNRRGVKPPRGKRWNASTINGSANRNNGILRNSIYRGVIEWNRVSMIKDPDTRKRISRPNPRSEWKTAPAPHLRIVSDELFEAAHARQAVRRSNGSMQAVRAARAPRHLLSGLLRCGSCGGGMCSVGASQKGGRARIICSAHRENGSCGNKKRTYLDLVEAKVIEGLRHHLEHPALINEFVTVYNAERRRLAKEASRERGAIERRLSSIDREIANLIDALKAGAGSAVAAIVATLEGLEAEKGKLSADLAVMGTAENVVSIHPRAVERYQRAMAEIGNVNEASSAEIEILRSLIATVTVYNDAAEGSPVIDIKGRIAALCEIGSVSGSGGALHAVSSPRILDKAGRLRRGSTITVLTAAHRIETPREAPGLSISAVSRRGLYA